MQTRALTRSHYRPDGGMRAAWWPIVLGGPLALALPLGYLLHALLQRGWYLVGVVTAVAALALGLLISIFVALAHCRKPVCVGAIGATAGLVMYLGSYYFGMLAQLPPGNALRLDLLPDYIVVRLKTDVGRAMGRPNQVRKPSLSTNCLGFLLDLAASMGVAAAVPVRRARRPYVPALGQ